MCLSVRQISSWYAKSRGEVYNFSPDTKAKEDHASPEGTYFKNAVLVYAQQHIRSVLYRGTSGR